MQTAISATGLSHSFGDQQVLSGLSLDVTEGELLAVVGPSGCGKSTLLELLCGLRTPQAGSVGGARAVLMPQHDALFPWFDATDNAALALRIAGMPRAAARARAGEVLAELGLGGALGLLPDRLSGGMRQRVAFARSLLSGAEVICLDEPFGALDAITRAETQRWLAATLARERRTAVLVTHDVEEAALLADRILVLSPAPAAIVAELPIDQPRPPEGRSPTSPDVLATRLAALNALTEAVAA